MKTHLSEALADSANGVSLLRDIEESQLHSRSRDETFQQS